MASKTREAGNHRLGALIARPAKPPALVAVSVVIVVAGAVYCSGYEALTTGYDNWPASLIWAAYALLPWYLMFEWIRWREQGRSQPLPAATIAALLIAVGAASLLAEQIDYRLNASDPPPVLLSLLRRAPGIVITLALIAMSRNFKLEDGAEAREKRGDVLTDWHAIRWIGAADNYLEVHYPGRVAMVRMTMREAEKQLGRRGFVRIHRSAMVKRTLIAAIAEDEVRLVDGEKLPVGKAFAANLRASG
jgi:hypothetical protein